MGMDSSLLAVRVDPLTRRMVEAEAEASGVPVSVILRAAITSWLLRDEPTSR